VRAYLIGAGVVVVTLFAAATFGPHLKPWVAGFAEILEDWDDA
jgi:hypothetical protein